MKFKGILTISFFSSAIFSISTIAADWDNTPIPLDAPAGHIWQLTNMSDDFNYTAPAVGKSDEFYDKWIEGFINQWKGPGLTQWSSKHSEVRDGFLRITTGRNEENGDVYAGSITSKESITYPVFMEVRAKISNMVTASNFWLLSKDSTQEIDVLEAYGSDRVGQEWFAERLHLSHHVFIREPFTDYQPTTNDTWYYKDGIKWKDDFHTIGVYWRDAWHLEYYVDGKFIKSSSGKDIIDPKDFTNGTGLNKPMQAIINTEAHEWRSDDGIAPTDEEMADTDKNLYLVDWVRFYKPVSKYDATDQTQWTDGETIKIKFSEFISTGKEDSTSESDTVLGFNISDDNINYNTVGDWAEYSVNFTKAGYYRAEFEIASPATQDIGVELSIDGEKFSTLKFESTGDWNSYASFSMVQPLAITQTGTYTIKLKSIGSEEWQWNGDEFRLVNIIPSSSNDITAINDNTAEDNTSDGDTDNGNNSSSSPNEDNTNEDEQPKDNSSGGTFGYFLIITLLLKLIRPTTH